MSKTLVIISDLQKLFHMGSSEVYALAGVNLEVVENSFTVVIGPSGSGKSTLLYLVGGLDRPTKGTIAVGDFHVNQLDENQLAH